MKPYSVNVRQMGLQWMLHEHANEDYYDRKFKRLNHLAAWALTLNGRHHCISLCILPPPVL